MIRMLRLLLLCFWALAKRDADNRERKFPCNANRASQWQEIQILVM